MKCECLRYDLILAMVKNLVKPGSKGCIVPSLIIPMVTCEVDIGWSLSLYEPKDVHIFLHCTVTCAAYLHITSLHQPVGSHWSMHGCGCEELNGEDALPISALHTHYSFWSLNKDFRRLHKGWFCSCAHMLCSDFCLVASL